MPTETTSVTAYRPGDRALASLAGREYPGTITGDCDVATGECFLFRRDGTTDGIHVDADRLRPVPVTVGARVRIHHGACAGDSNVGWVSPRAFNRSGIVAEMVGDHTAFIERIPFVGTHYVNLQGLSVIEDGAPDPPIEEETVTASNDDLLAEGDEEQTVSCGQCGDEIGLTESILLGGSDVCRDCASRCPRCGSWELSSEFSYIETRGYSVCEDCWHYCPRCDDEPITCDEESCSMCDGEIEGVEGYGHTVPEMWLGEKLPVVNGHHDGYYLGMELEVSASSGNVAPLHDWAERELGSRRALVCKEDSSVDGFEIAFQPMRPEFFESVNWASFFDVLNSEFPLRGEESVEHGLHVHIGKVAFKRNGLTDDLSVASYTYLLTQGEHLERIGRREPTGYCAKVQKPVSVAIVTSPRWRASSQGQRLIGQVYAGRDAVNLQNGSTIEVRAFRSTRKEQEFRNAVRVTYLAADYIRHLREQKSSSNPKALHWTEFARWVGAEHPDKFANITGLDR